MDARIRDMTPDDTYYVSTCSHVHESDEIDACGRARAAWLREAWARGARVKVAVDLFWQTFCETSWIEAQRVREVSAEFGDAVALREYPVDDRAVLLRHQIPRAIYVNGRQIDWGYEAPREGIREAISRALEAQE